MVMRLNMCHFTTVNADPELENVVGAMADFELLDAGQ